MVSEKLKNILLINIINSIIAFPFLLSYYLKAHGSPSGFGMIEVGAMGVFLIGPLALISSIISTVVLKEKSPLIIIKSVLLLIFVTYLFTALLLVKGVDLIITFVTIFVFIVLISAVGYVLSIIVQKLIKK